MQIELSRARRAYELGRLRGSAVRASGLTALAALLALWLREGDPWRLLPVTFVLWFAAHYWGRTLLKGARIGLLAGLATVLVPLSWLRPCCVPGLVTGSQVCTMPGICVLTGALIGLALATSAPRSLWSAGQRLEATLGVAVGVLTLVWLKCSLLLWGETIGLLAGLGTGIAAISLTPLMRPLRS